MDAGSPRRSEGLALGCRRPWPPVTRAGPQPKVKRRRTRWGGRGEPAPQRGLGVGLPAPLAAGTPRRPQPQVRRHRRRSGGPGARAQRGLGVRLPAPSAAGHPRRPATRIKRRRITQIRRRCPTSWRPSELPRTQDPGPLPLRRLPQYRTKSSSLQLAPPTSAPSISSYRTNSATLAPVALPPYSMRTWRAAARVLLLQQPRIRRITFTAPSPVARLAGADGPDGLVGHHHLGDALGRQTAQAGAHLAGHDGVGLAGVVLLLGLAHADVSGAGCAGGPPAPSRVTSSSVSPK